MTHENRSERSHLLGSSRRPIIPEGDDIFVGTRDLPSYGIAYHPNHLRRLWTEGHFPRPIHLSPRKLAWRRSTILAWIAAKAGDAEA